MYLKMMCKFAIFFFLFSCAAATKTGVQCDGSIRYLGEDDWHVILKGKWVVKFYANWCPACKSFMADWEVLAKEFHKEGFCAASADVSTNADLSGRFFVTSLPTFYLIHEGEIRMYSGPRTRDALRAFALDGGWKETPVVPWYISPTSYHMATLGTFFKFSMSLRNFHTHVTENWGVPAWVSYISFAIFTILVGLLFGLFVVFLCDVGFGPASAASRKKKVDPFLVDASIADADEDVVDDEEEGSVPVQDGEDREKEKEGEEEDDEEEEEEREREGEVEADEEEDEEEEEEEDQSGRQGESEADDEGEGMERRPEDEGSGEPRRRKKVSAHAKGTADDDDDDDEEEEEGEKVPVVDGDVDKKK